MDAGLHHHHAKTKNGNKGCGTIRLWRQHGNNHSDNTVVSTKEWAFLHHRVVTTKQGTFADNRVVHIKGNLVTRTKRCCSLIPSRLRHSLNLTSRPRNKNSQTPITFRQINNPNCYTSTSKLEPSPRKSSIEHFWKVRGFTASHSFFLSCFSVISTKLDIDLCRAQRRHRSLCC